MGVRGTGGVGAGVSRGRPPHPAYYVALAAILSLLAVLLLYFFYFFINKIRKFSSVETLTTPTARPAAPPPYPVQPVVREGASEMARLCKQLPPSGKGDTVFPASTSPAALRTDTGGAPTAPTGPTAPTDIAVPPATGLKAAPAVPTVVVDSITAP